ncbi:alpha/beta hydrolase family protein [Frateuria aurantia]
MAENAGCISLTVADPQGPGPIRCHVLYPSHAPASLQRFGHYPVELALDAALPATTLPQVLISHGNGGSPWTHRDLAVDLARHGHLVILPEHSGNCVGDNRLAGTLANLVNRPRQLSLALDAVASHPQLSRCLAGPQVAVIGHSLGGYTALAAAGGQPLAGPQETPDGKAQPVPVHADPRITRLVLLAPAAGRFGAPQALAGVHQPILIWAAELDTLTPPSEAEWVQQATASGQTELRIIPGAGHFSFLSPFPAVLDRPGFAPAHDPPGFDRQALQPLMQQAVRQFLRTPIPVCGDPLSAG